MLPLEINAWNVLISTTPYLILLFLNTSVHCKLSSNLNQNLSSGDFNSTKETSYNFMSLPGEKLKFIPGNLESLKSLCSSMKAALEFTNNSETVIISNHQNVDRLIANDSDKCCYFTTYTVVNVPQETNNFKQIEYIIRMWIKQGVRKFILFCSLELASIILSIMKTTMTSYLSVDDTKPILFVFDRAVLFTSVQPYPTIVAVERRKPATGDNGLFQIEEIRRDDKEEYGLYCTNQAENKWRLYGIVQVGVEHTLFHNLIYQKLLKDYPYHVDVTSNKRILRVATLVELPYIQIHPQSDYMYDARQNKCYYGKVCWQTVDGLKKAVCCIGYLIDLLEKIEMDMEFDSYVYFVEDDVFGEIVNGSWVGLIGDLVAKKADIILGALTISRIRAQVVDFTYPFIEGGMALVTVYKNRKIPFANIKPFNFLTFGLWLGTLLIPFGTIALLVLTHKAIGRNYSWRESFTYMMGLLFQRDMGGKNPTTLSSRTISIFISMFTLIIMSTYTAVLTANTVTSARYLEITGFQYMKIQNPTNAFKFGTMANSAFSHYFSSSDNPVWRRVSIFMKRYNLKNGTKAMEQLSNGELNAFIQDYNAALYYISRDRESRFVIVGDVINKGGFALAVQKGSSLADKMSHLILRYQKDESLLKLQSKWMKNEALAKDKPNTAHEMETRYFGGIFIALGGFTILCVLILLFEMFIYRQRRSGNYKVAKRT